MLERLSHRGGEVGVWADGPCALGWRARDTESSPTAGKQAVQLVGQMRIHNRAELAHALGIGVSDDAGLVLEAYRKWGCGAPSHLIGDFALVVWDAERRSALCARDHLGVKPFHYFVSREIFAFATEVGALLALPEVPRRLNERTVADLLLPMVEDHDSTLYADVSRLPPAHSLLVRPTTTERRAFWQPDASREIRLGSDDEYAERFRHLLTQAIADRLRGPGPPGAALSGGLDSSSVATIAQRLLAPGRLKTFTAVYEETPETDEREFARAVAQHADVEAHDVRPERFSPLENSARAIWKASEPHWNPQIALAWAVLESGREQGLQAMLEGFGGDWVVSFGLARLAELARAGRIRSLLSESAALSRRGGQTTSSMVVWYGLRPLVPAGLARIARPLRRRRSAWLDDVPLATAFASRPEIAERVALADAEGLTRARSARLDHARHLSSGIGHFSLGMLDRVYAEHGIEPRFPFLDVRLAEHCLALPADQKLRDGWTRWSLRSAMGGVLPEQVRWRLTKANLGFSFSRKLLTVDREVIEEALFRNPGSIAQYVDLEAFRVDYERLQTVSHLAPEAIKPAYALWRVAALALWLDYNKLP